ncbi:MAG TPA: DUF2505 family protein [Polyangiaceae bacterium]
MAGHFETQHEFDTDEKTFWEECMLNEKFNTGLFLDTLKFPGWTQLEQKDDGQKITRKVKIDPPLTGMPGPLAKALGDKFSYIEEGTYDRATQRYEFKITPSTMADKTHTSGAMWTEKKGDKIVRHAKVDIEAKIFMLGKLIEDKVVGDLKTTYEAAAAFTRKYVESKKA